MKPFFPYDQKVKTKNYIPSEPKELLRWNKKSIFHHYKKAFTEASKAIFLESEGPTSKIFFA